MTPRRFFFARKWLGVTEPQVVIVRSRAALETGYNASDSDVIEVPYAGGSWRKFLHKAGDTLSIGSCNEQVFIEVVSDRSRKRPVIVYVPNAAALAKECSDELVRFIAFWEAYAMNVADGPDRILLALQFPERQQ